MTRTVYLNGSFIAETEAKVSIFDRGLLFADAVYEGFGVLDGEIMDFLGHMARLYRSLGELDMTLPISQDDLFRAMMTLIRRNGVTKGFLYLHYTRGEADRDYLFSDDLRPNLFAFTQKKESPSADAVPVPVKVHCTPDLRWSRRDIKTTNLLGQVLAKRAAKEAGAYEAIMVEANGNITEGGATSFFIVKDGKILARPVSNDILHGITRQAMLAVAKEQGIVIEDRHFTVAEACEAEEAFLTGASTFVAPVGWIDDKQIADGKAGPIALKLREEYLKRIRADIYKPNS